MDLVAAIVGIAAGGIGALGAWYTYGPYRARKQEERRERFVEEREFLNTERVRLQRLSRALYPDQMHAIPGMLSDPLWTPPAPFPIAQLDLVLAQDEIVPALRPRILHEVRMTLLPSSQSGTVFATYSSTLEHLSRPRLFANRLCYSLRGADFGPAPRLELGLARYFEAIDENEAVAHETAHALIDGGSDGALSLKRLPIRSLVPTTSLGDRSAVCSVSALTLIRSGTRWGFYLHARSNTDVAMGANQLHVVPSGVFQPASDHASTIKRDLSIWYTLCREYAEEYLNTEEAKGEDGMALSYDTDAPYAQINHLYASGRMSVSVVGLGLDPLTLFPELLTVSTMDEQAFDDVFSEMVTRNEEGAFRGEAVSGGRIQRFAFDEETVTGLVASASLSPGARGLLALAWRWREELTGQG